MECDGSSSVLLLHLATRRVHSVCQSISGSLHSVTLLAGGWRCWHHNQLIAETGMSESNRLGALRRAVHPALAC